MIQNTENKTGRIYLFDNIKFLKEFRVGKLLFQCNAGKMKGIPVMDIFRYLFCLIFSDRSMYMQRKTGVFEGGFCKNTVYRFLNNTKTNWQRFTTLLSARIINDFMKPLTSDNRKDVFIIDDSLFDRSRSCKTELLARVFDHCSMKYKRGYRMLTLGWSDGNSFIPVNHCLLSAAEDKNLLCEASSYDGRSLAGKRRKQSRRKATEVMLELIHMAYIESKYCDVTSPNFCSYMTEDQRSIAYRNEKRMLQTGGKYSAGFARYDYALRNYKDVYTGASRSTGYIRNTDKEKQYARSVVNQQISNLFSKNGISLSKQADLTFSIDPYTYQLTVSGNADRDTLSQIEKLLNEGDNAKNIWTHAWICMHDADNEIVNSQANMTKANQYSLWHEVYETTGYDARNATYRNGTFIAEDGTDLLALFKEKAGEGPQICKLSG